MIPIEFKLSMQFIIITFLLPKFWSSEFNLKLFSQVSSSQSPGNGLCLSIFDLMDLSLLAFPYQPVPMT